MTLSLEELLEIAGQADGPAVPSPNLPKPGGVDPLGLRQVNFNLMDRSLPGLNNVARRVRPFVVVAWASRQAARIAQASGKTELPIDDIRDFVDRIEVLYAWSQFRLDPNAELPGRQVLASLIDKDSYVFGGPGWKKRREQRRFSTAFTAAITYGPALKALGWVYPDARHSVVLHASPRVDAALDAFEAGIAEHLAHPAFSQFGEVEVTGEEIEVWGSDWSLDAVTPEEQRVFVETLCGDDAPAVRRSGIALMLEAARHAQEANPERIRALMAGEQADFSPAPALIPAAAAWRQLQVRQLFRLALESLMYWIVWALESGPHTTAELVDVFLEECEGGWPLAEAPGAWLASTPAPGAPTQLMQRIQEAAADPGGVDLAQSIAEAVAFCLAEPQAEAEGSERADRLPLTRARREAEAWSATTSTEFLKHMVESWVLAQHVYWSIGRGLNDARAGGKTLLRLRVVMDEGGWRLAPGASLGNPPLPTPDRLASALSLACECSLLGSKQNGN